MNPNLYKIINDFPENFLDCVIVEPNKDRDAFIRDLRYLLQTGGASVCAKEIPNDWAELVEEFATEIGYRISVLRDKEMGENFGTFFYDFRN